MFRVNNANARKYVQAKSLFKGSNLFSERVSELYVVYSYGTHWPLFVYDRVSNVWYENMDKKSGTTSRHRKQAHPQCETILMGVDEILEFIKSP